MRGTIHGAGENATVQAIAGAPDVGKATIVKELKALASMRATVTTDSYFAILPDVLRVFVLAEARLYCEGLSHAFALQETVRVLGAQEPGEEALARIASTSPGVVLVDSATVRRSDIVRRTTTLVASCIAVAFGVSDEPAEVLACAQSGVAGYAPREATLDDLLRTVASIVGGERPCPEFEAVVTLAWFHLTVSANTGIVQNLNAESASAALRLKRIGERVGIPMYSSSDSYFPMARPMSEILLWIESGLLETYAPVERLDDDAAPASLSQTMQIIITHWSIATGRNIKGDSLRVGAWCPWACLRCRPPCCARPPGQQPEWHQLRAWSFAGASAVECAGGTAKEPLETARPAHDGPRHSTTAWLSRDAYPHRPATRAAPRAETRIRLWGRPLSVSLDPRAAKGPATRRGEPADFPSTFKQRSPFRSPSGESKSCIQKTKPGMIARAINELRHYAVLRGAPVHA